MEFGRQYSWRSVTMRCRRYRCREICVLTGWRRISMYGVRFITRCQLVRRIPCVSDWVMNGVGPGSQLCDVPLVSASW